MADQPSAQKQTLDQVRGQLTNGVTGAWGKCRDAIRTWLVGNAYPEAEITKIEKELNSYFKAETATKFINALERIITGSSADVQSGLDDLRSEFN